MNAKLLEIIKSSSFNAHKGKWIYAKVKSMPRPEDCFMISQDKDEITVVIEQKKIDKVEVIEQNEDLRKLIEVKVSAPFYAVGFLAAITGTISSKGCNNLIISTYSKDYVLITLEQFERTKEALIELGLREEINTGADQE